MLTNCNAEDSLVPSLSTSLMPAEGLDQAITGITLLWWLYRRPAKILSALIAQSQVGLSGTL